MRSSSSWCAHHAFSDVKSCNMHLPCNIISTIAKDPEFRIQTALLYIRSNPTQQDASLPVLSFSDSNGKASENHSVSTGPGGIQGNSGIEICRNEADLGLLHLHRDRLAAAADALGWGDLDCLNHTETSLHLIRNELQNHIRGLSPLPDTTCESRKVQVLVDRTGNITVKSAGIVTEKISQSSENVSHEWLPESLDESPGVSGTPSEVYLDLQPSRPSTLTTHKTNHRCVYTSARERLGLMPGILPTVREVLLFNPYGEITETSSCTVYFKRNGIWVTPAAVCGCTLGVTRRLAIEKGLCRQGIIEVEDLKTNEQVWLSNGVRGFFRGVLATDAQTLKERAQSEAITLAKLGAGAGSDAGYGRALKNV